MGRQALIAAMPAGELLTQMLASMGTPSALYCCQPDESGSCPEIQGRPAMTQAGVWDKLVTEWNKMYKLKDVCTSGHVEGQCAELNKKSP